MRIEKITSRENEKVKYARRVRDGKEPASIFIEGSRLGGEALSSTLEIETVFVTHRFTESQSFSKIANKLEQVFTVPESLLESIADTNSPQGIVILAKRPAFKFADAETGMSIFLYQINNPANLGAVVRTAEAAGFDRILISLGSADPFSSKALRASMGSAFRTQIFEGCVLDSAIERSKKNGTEVVAVDAKGSSIYSADFANRPRMFVFGSEAHGLPDEVLNQVVSVVSIPMNSPVESLNLAVSCGIILFEARRQTEQNK